MDNEQMEKEQLLHRFLNGTATPEEIKILETDAAYASYMKISKATQGFQTPAFDADWNYVKINEIRSENSKVKRLKPLQLFLKVAAAVTILFAGYLFMQDGETTIRTQIAEKQDFFLPDSSRITLNAQSEISYHKSKWNQERTLRLQGEAFFRVEKGKTFSVQTNQGVITVLGTQFNVFSRDTLLNIKCYEGLVSVNFSDTTVQIPAGTGLKIINQDRIRKSEVVNFSPNWIANESTFENVSLSLVLEELKRQYPIMITSHNIVDKKFTGSFTHTDLNVALRSICDPLQVDFTIEGEEVTLHAKKNN